MGNFAVIIPALNPGKMLIHYVDSLLANGAAHIIIVNDGSKDECAPIFEEIEKNRKCTVLQHSVNRGKGRALKTAFAYFLEHHANLIGVITADADGQHTAADVTRIAEALNENRNGIILGARDFNQANVPAKSKIGNRLTSFMFEALYGAKVGDTQTGLRGIPKQELPWMVALKGERFEYEMNMLIYAKRMKVALLEVPVQTIYFNHNAGTNYHSIKDSFKIFRKILSGMIYYAYPALLYFLIDMLSFALFFRYLLNGVPFLWKLFVSTVLSQLAAFGTDMLAKRKLLHMQHFFVRSIGVLCGFIVIAFSLLAGASAYLQLDLLFAKLAASVILAVVFYQIQLHWDVIDTQGQAQLPLEERRHG